MTTRPEPAAMPRLRILFALLSPELIRFYDATIRRLAERGHTVSVAVERSEKRRAARQARLDEWSGTVGRVEMVGLAPRRGDIWQSLARRIRGTMDYARFLDARFAEAPVLRARMMAKVQPFPGWIWRRIGTLSAARRAAVLRGLRMLERAVPPSRRTDAFLARTAPDVLLVSPIVDPASDQVDLVKSAQARGIRTGVCIPSWDNLTSKGLIRVEPDAVFVWNEVQKAEAVAYHGSAPERVVVTGAQPFDRWFGRRPRRERAPFCQRVGLPAERPFVLFAGTSDFLPNGNAEVSFVRRWLRLMREHPDPLVRELAVLVRPHPYNFEQWEAVELSELGPAAVWPRHGSNPADEDDRADYFDSLYHAAAVVGLNTSAFLEAVIVGRPVYTVRIPEWQAAQDGTLHFRYLLPDQGGVLRVADSFEEHFGQLAEGVRGRPGWEAERLAFLRAFVRPRGLDRDATDVLAGAVEELGRQPLVQPGPIPSWACALRPVLWVAAAWWTAWDGLASGDWQRRWGGAWRMTLHTKRKTAYRAWVWSATRVHRLRKRARSGLGRRLRRVVPALRGRPLAPAREPRVDNPGPAPRPAAQPLWSRAGWFVIARAGRFRQKAWRGARLLREQGALYRAEWRLVRELEQTVRGSAPIVVGPWLSEVGYELLYWIPFLRWVREKYELDPRRVVAVSRGGVGWWYREFAGQYVEIFDLMDPAEFARQNARRREAVDLGHKQLGLSPLDDEILGLVRAKLGLGEARVLHPSLMYRLFQPFWREQWSLRALERYLRFVRMPAPEPRVEGLPEDYVAVKFYTAAALADVPDTRAALRQVVRRLAEHTAVVLLDTGFAVDDHDDYLFGGSPRIISARTLMTPQTNLGVQTRVLGRARAFVGTCGGLAWLAPMLGVDTVAVLTDTRFLHAHLHVALRAYAAMGAASFAPVDLRGLARLGLLADPEREPLGIR